MHYAIMGFQNQFVTHIEVMKSDAVQIKRRPSQIVFFKDVENFIDAIRGKKQVVVTVGKEVNKDGETTENWKAFYWEPGDPKKSYGFMEGESLFPLGTLAILEMGTEYDLGFALDVRQKEARKWNSLMEEAENLARKIHRIDDESSYASSRQFQYMTAEELEKTLPEMREEYRNLSQRSATEM